MRHYYCRRAISVAAVVVVVLAGLAPIAAQDASVRYLEGDPEHRLANGRTDWLDFGSTVRAGDSVVTGPNDFVELDQGAGAEIRVQPGTVFTVREVQTGTTRETVMSTAVGSVRYRFNQVAGRTEPRVGTAAVVAGIRGTELTVYAAADGSSLFVVESGEVEVSNAGRSVTLTENQGVEVAAGAPPGEVFEVIGREEDFGDWVLDRGSSLVSDPAVALDALDGIAQTLEGYIGEMDEWVRRYEAAKVESDAALAELDNIADETQRNQYRDEVWFPRAVQTATSVLNFRYYALSALSLRRYVLGPMYMEYRTRTILASTPDVDAFFDRHSEIVERYDNAVSRYLEPTDI